MGLEKFMTIANETILKPTVAFQRARLLSASSSDIQPAYLKLGKVLADIPGALFCTSGVHQPPAKVLNF